MEKYDVIIVGGGSAGLMAGIAAGKHGAKTLLVDKGDKLGRIPRQQWRELSRLIKMFPVHVDGTLSIEEAFVTGGGVNLKEIDPKTMQSKFKRGLFFCGEILDIHGYTGGYNITAAFSTGYTAGSHAAQLARDL